MLVSIGKASNLLGISVSTLRLWERQSKIKPFCRTEGGHRRYRIQDLHEKFGINQRSEKRFVVAYGRVSSSDQRQDLERQKETLEQWKHQHHPEKFELISNLGSGLNFKKRGLRKVLSMILNGRVKRLILCHQDRLLRFGNELIFLLCDHFGVEIQLLEEKKSENEEIKLAKDVITIITVFTSKLYGRRSHEKRRARIIQWETNEEKSHLR